MKKALGIEIMDFYENGWPEGMYHEVEDESLSPLDLSKDLEPAMKYDLSRFGFLYPESSGDGSRQVCTFSTAFGRWKKASTTAVLQIEPKSRAGAAVKALEAAGFKVKVL